MALESEPWLRECSEYDSIDIFAIIDSSAFLDASIGPLPTAVNECELPLYLISKSLFT